MEKTEEKIIEQCRSLRKQGKTLGEILKQVSISKTTAYKYIADIPLPEGIHQQKKRENCRRLSQLSYRQRKQREKDLVSHLPEQWTDDYVLLVSHLLFDGELKPHYCAYSNRNTLLVERVRTCMEKYFHMRPPVYFRKTTGVSRISYANIALAHVLQRSANSLLMYIRNASPHHKYLFIRAFFDDEGCIDYKPKEKTRRVRGFQHSRGILLTVQELLFDFGIESTIDSHNTELRITRKENLIKFRDSINFSEAIKVNGKRKNSVWKKDLEKRDILDMAIESYKSFGAPGIHKIKH